jgi:hypothetical protein
LKVQATVALADFEQAPAIVGLAGVGQVQVMAQQVVFDTVNIVAGLEPAVEHL